MLMILKSGESALKASKWLLVVFVIVAVVGFYWFELDALVSFAALQQQKQDLRSWVLASPLQASLSYFAVYVLVTAFSLPGAALMTLAAGAMFGVLWGVLLVSFASTIGASLAFLVSRYVLRDGLEQRFKKQMEQINQGIVKDGAFYLFSLRLIPLFPFFVINLVMGLTQLPLRTFYWVSQLGMLAGTIVYVNAGTQLAQLESASGIISLPILASFALLAVFPWLAKILIGRLKAGRVMKAYKRPKRFDRNLVVIGAGAAGLVSSYIAATVKARVTLIEKHKMGGDCLNTGCVPSKALIRSAKFYADARRASELGFAKVTLECDFDQIMERVQRVIRRVEPHDSVERYSDLGVECLQGQARVLSPYEVEVNNQVLTTRAIIIATGARPYVPDIPGLQALSYFTSDTIWSLRTKPQRLLVLGAGPIGCELSQAFARLGCELTLLQRGARVMPREDEDVSVYVRGVLEQDGVTVMTEYEAVEVRAAEGAGALASAGALLCKNRQNGEMHWLEFDALLLAMGRKANVEGFGLEELGVTLNTDGTIATNAYQQTRIPTIYASGDVAGPYQFTHTAAHQSWYAAVNAMFGFMKRFKVDYSVIPWTTFVDPEVARVGLNEQEAQAQGVDYELTRYGIDDLDRAIADESAKGFIKVLTVPGRDHILGVTIVAPQAGELLAEYVLAMKHGLGLNKILATIHTYPTLSEANKYAAGEWKKAHAPQWALRLSERLLRWRRD
jgi:pyruvate/2-oxoglutarate dehydrogenase complex dihydrolipoamide dehydrogenase (E3) component/uncharacterized membrane protein YdjX (TVP38/TMEM64 family)